MYFFSHCFFFFQPKNAVGFWQIKKRSFSLLGSLKSIRTNRSAPGTSACAWARRSAFSFWSLTSKMTRRASQIIWKCTTAMMTSQALQGGESHSGKNTDISQNCGNDNRHTTQLDTYTVQVMIDLSGVVKPSSFVPNILHPSVTVCSRIGFNKCFSTSIFSIQRFFCTQGRWSCQNL